VTCAGANGAGQVDAAPGHLRPGQTSLRRDTFRRQVARRARARGDVRIGISHVPEGRRVFPAVRQGNHARRLQPPDSKRRFRGGGRNGSISSGQYVRIRRAWLTCRAGKCRCAVARGLMAKQSFGLRALARPRPVMWQLCSASISQRSRTPRSCCREERAHGVSVADTVMVEPARSCWAASRRIVGQRAIRAAISAATPRQRPDAEGLLGVPCLAIAGRR